MSESKQWRSRALFRLTVAAFTIVVIQAASAAADPPVHPNLLVVEDVAALRSAVGQGGPIYVQPGTYRLSQPLAIETPVHLVMDREARFVADWDNQPSQGVVYVTRGADGSRLDGIRIDGNGNRLQGIRLANVADVQLKNLEIVNLGEQGIMVSGSQRVLIQDVHLERTQTHDDTSQIGAVRVASSRDVVIERVHVHDTGGKGIAFGNSRRCVLRDSVVHDTQRDAGDGIYFNNSHHISVYRCTVLDPQGNALKISRRSSHIRVRDCWLEQHRGVGVGLFIQGGIKCHVTDSRIQNERGGNAVQVSQHPLKGAGGPAVDNVIVGNHLVSSRGHFFGEGAENVRGTVVANNVYVRPEDDER